MIGMKRREFIAALGIAAVLPSGARAQERVRRIGVLTNLRPDDAEIQQRLRVPQCCCTPESTMCVS